jgi:hypothetical protein
VDAAKAAAALAFHREIEAAVASNQKLPPYQTGGYSIYPVVGLAQETNLSARLTGGNVTLLQTYKGQALGGDGTVPRFAAIPIELSDNPIAAMYAATQHGSLQNADAVISHLIGLLSGFDLDLGDFKKPKIQVALEVEDVYFADEPIVVRARPSHDDVVLHASLWRPGENQPLARLALPRAGGGWRQVELAAPGTGAYRVTVAGPDVEMVEDSFVVAEITAQDL